MSTLYEYRRTSVQHQGRMQTEEFINGNRLQVVPAEHRMNTWHWYRFQCSAQNEGQ